MLNHLFELAAYTLAFITGALAGEWAYALSVSLEAGTSSRLSLQPACACCGRYWSAYFHPRTLGYLAENGICRRCGSPLPKAPLLAELTGGIGLAALLYRYGPSLESLLGMVFLTLMLVVFITGLTDRKVPDNVLGLLLSLGFLTALFTRFVPVDFLMDRIWWNQPAGAMGIALFMLVLSMTGSLMGQGGTPVGSGDIKLLAAVGFCLGWRLAVAALFLSIVLAGLLGAYLLLCRARLRSSMPFSPIIAFSSVISLLYGQSFILWFTGIL